MMLIRGHSFQPQHYYTTTVCNVCNSNLGGVGNQGYQCDSEHTLLFSVFFQRIDTKGKKKQNKRHPANETNNAKICLIFFFFFFFFWKWIWQYLCAPLWSTVFRLPAKHKGWSVCFEKLWCRSMWDTNPRSQLWITPTCFLTYFQIASSTCTGRAWTSCGSSALAPNPRTKSATRCWRKSSVNRRPTTPPQVRIPTVPYTWLRGPCCILSVSSKKPENLERKLASYRASSATGTKSHFLSHTRQFDEQPSPTILSFLCNIIWKKNCDPFSFPRLVSHQTWKQSHFERKIFQLQPILFSYFGCNNSFSFLSPTQKDLCFIST